MEIASWAKPLITSSGVLEVGEMRVVYHALNAARDPSVAAPILLNEMILDGEILYVSSRIIGVEMPFELQEVAMKKMKDFVRGNGVRGC